MPQIAFLFPGQGAQAVGMGKQLYEALPEVRTLYDEAAEVLGYSLAEVCWNGPVERLNSTVISQPAIFVASLAALQSLRAREPAGRSFRSSSWAIRSGARSRSLHKARARSAPTRW